MGNGGDNPAGLVSHSGEGGAVEPLGSNAALALN